MRLLHPAGALGRTDRSPREDLRASEPGTGADRRAGPDPGGGGSSILGDRERQAVRGRCGNQSRAEGAGRWLAAARVAVPGPADRMGRRPVLQEDRPEKEMGLKKGLGKGSGGEGLEAICTSKT